MLILPKLQELDIAHKRVFVRVDFNVPISDGKVSDDTRIRAALPTIKYIIEHEGKCILGSHLGRPKGQVNLKYSLEPVASRLSELLGKQITMPEDCVGDGPRSLSLQMRRGDVMLLQNLRFHEGEESNNPNFVNALAELADIYVGDAFGTLHRAHASTAGLPDMFSGNEKGIGLLIQSEMEHLSALQSSPSRPFVLVMGGAKVTDKIGIVSSLISKVDTILIGGAMAYAFLRAQGKKIGDSLCKDDQVATAKTLLTSADARGVKIELPVDHVVARSLEDTDPQITDGVDIAGGFMGTDIGPKTLLNFQKHVEGASTIFWNGPMGVFEKDAFAKGTFELARLISESSAKKLAGGGDVVAAIVKSGCESKFDFISTGGGATLEFLEGKTLPGLKSLALSKRAIEREMDHE